MSKTDTYFYRKWLLSLIHRQICLWPSYYYCSCILSFVIYTVLYMLMIEPLVNVTLNGYSTPKWTFCHYSLTRMSFQLHKSFVRFQDISDKKCSVTTVTSVPWRGNECCVRNAMGNALRDRSWRTCEINPRCNWDVRAGDVTNQDAIKPSQTKLSLA